MIEYQYTNKSKKAKQRKEYENRKQQSKKRLPNHPSMEFIS